MPEANLSELASNVGIVLIFLVFLWKAGSAFITALNDLTKSNNLIAKETKKAAKEAAERNGHLGEQNIQITELISNHTKVMEENFKKLDNKLAYQEVIEQVVEHQTIKE